MILNDFITQFKVQTYRLVIKAKPISFRRDGTLDKQEMNEESRRKRIRISNLKTERETHTDKETSRKKI